MPMGQEILLRNIDEFYKAFIRKDRLEEGDIDAQKYPPPITGHFRIHRTEYALRLIGTELPPNRYDFYFISLVRKGTAKKTDWLSTFDIKPHTLWGTPLGQLHSAKDWSSDASGYYISFSADFIVSEPLVTKLLQQLPLFLYDGQHYLYLNEKESDELYAIFERMEKEFNNGEKLDALVKSLIKVYLSELLLLTKRLFDKKTPLAAGEVTRSLSDRYRLLIEKHFLHEKSVAFYADKLQVHPNHLNSVCKEQTGSRASELIKERVLAEAKALLYQTQLSVKEIAYYLEFKDSSHFSKFFKSITSLSPLSYRQKCKHLP